MILTIFGKPIPFHVLKSDLDLQANGILGSNYLTFEKAKLCFHSQTILIASKPNSPIPLGRIIANSSCKLRFITRSKTNFNSNSLSQNIQRESNTSIICSIENNKSSKNKSLSDNQAYKFLTSYLNHTQTFIDTKGDEHDCSVENLASHERQSNETFVSAPSCETDSMTSRIQKSKLVPHARSTPFRKQALLSDIRRNLDKIQRRKRIQVYLKTLGLINGKVHSVYMQITTPSSFKIDTRRHLKVPYNYKKKRKKRVKRSQVTLIR